MAELNSVPTSSKPFLTLDLKNILKLVSFLFLLLGSIKTIYYLVYSLGEINDFVKYLNECKKDFGDIKTEAQVAIWSDHIMYTSLLFLAVYGTIRESYPVLLFFSIVHFILVVVSLCDFEGFFEFVVDFLLTIFMFALAVFYRMEQLISWNPFATV